MSPLHVSELAILICSFSEVSDCVSLSRTCRLLFGITVPFIWEKVYGVKNLLALLDSIYSHPDPLRIILREKEVKPDAFSRFDFYAPHVKYLQAYGRVASNITIIGWPILLSRAQQRTLLPNLQQLTINAPRHSHWADQPLWIATFASSSLTSVSILPPPSTALAPLITHRTASCVMQFLAHQQTKIQKLDLFPSEEASMPIGEGGVDILRPFLPGNTLNFYEYLTGFNTLTHLSGTFTWFEKEPFLVLSRLPHLESISIYLDQDTNGPDSGLDELLSDDSFPSLRELTLDRAYIGDALGVMCNKRFVERITTFRLGIEDEEFGFDSIHGIWDIEDSDFPRIFENLISLNKLGIIVYEADILLPFDQLTLWPLLELPLQSMVLRGINIEDFELVTEELDAAWPDMVNLRVLDCSVTLGELTEYALLPKLRHLEMKLDFRNPKKPGTYSHKPDPVNLLLETIKSSAGGSMCSTTEEMDIIASALLVRWPNLKFVEWDTEDEQLLSLVSQLNHRIDTARQSQDPDSVIRKP